jgi:hypothetical protein
MGTCCRERTTGRGDGGVVSDTSAPVRFCLVPMRSSALLCVQTSQVAAVENYVTTDHQIRSLPSRQQ